MAEMSNSVVDDERKQLLSTSSRSTASSYRNGIPRDVSQMKTYGATTIANLDHTMTTNPTMDGEESNVLIDAAAKPKKKSYAIVCIMYMLYGISFSLLIPALPGLTLHLTNGDSSRSSMLFGMATFIRYILEFFSAPILGSLADSQGRKLVFTLAFVVMAVEFVMLALLPSIEMIFITRAMSGLGDAGIATAHAMVTDIAMHNGDVVTQKYGLLGAMTGLAFIVGPLCGGYLCTISMPLCFAVSAATSTLGAICTWLFLEETKPTVIAKNVKEDVEVPIEVSCQEDCGTCLHKTWISLNPFDGLRIHLSNARLRKLLIPLGISALSSGLPFIWFLYLHHKFHATSTQIGIFLSFHGLMHAAAQGIFLKIFVPRWLNERNAALCGFLFAAIHAIANGVSQNISQLYIFSFVFCLSIIHYPACKAVIVNESLHQVDGLKFQANLQGTISSIRTFATAFGSLLFTSLFSYGISLRPIEIPGLPYYVAGGIYSTSFLILFLAIRAINEEDLRIKLEQEDTNIQLVKSEMLYELVPESLVNEDGWT